MNEFEDIERRQKQISDLNKFHQLAQKRLQPQGPNPAMT